MIGELGPLEAEVMDHAWKHNGPITVRDVVDSIGARQGLAYTTIMTVMERLADKGFMQRRKVGRAYSYHPKLSREEYSARLLRSVFAASKDRRSVLLGFVKSVNKNDLEELERLVRQAQRQAKSRRRP